MDGFRAAAALLPPGLRDAAAAVDGRVCEELRLRLGRPPTALSGGRETPFSGEAVTEAQLRAVLEAASRSSLHAVTEQLKRGYLTAPGGVRVGVCGTAVTDGGGRLTGFRSFTSLALRVPRAVPSCADGVWDAVTEGGFRSLLVISPPGAGKTTLLRELIRRLSDGGERVCVADERGEIAGPGFPLGRHTDVMTGAAKAAAAEMLLRAMNPAVLAMDEITDEADAARLLQAAGCGVRLLATVHGLDPADVARRPACRTLLASGVFERYVVISRTGRMRRFTAGVFPVNVPAAGDAAAVTDAAGRRSCV